MPAAARVVVVAAARLGTVTLRTAQMVVIMAETMAAAATATAVALAKQSTKMRFRSSPGSMP